jgi:hypothetical protein
MVLLCDKTSADLASIRPRAARPTEETIEDSEMIVTLAWNQLGFHLVEALAKGRIFHAQYYRDNTVTALIKLFPARGGRGFVIHAYNTRRRLLKNVRPFVQKMRCDSLHIRPIHRISDRRISSSSDMSRNACRE